MYNPDHKLPAAPRYFPATVNSRITGYPASLDEICRKVLTEKNMTDASVRKKVRECDLSRMQYALTQIKTFNVNHSLHQFFGLDFSVLPRFMLGNQSHRLNHMGMETYTPLDSWLIPVDHWVSELSERMNEPVNLLHTTRFPSSQALQNRVGARVEILCVWVQINQVKLMMELFDIARPVPESLYCHDLAAPDSFQHDLIWHYAIDVASASRVDELHECFVELTLEKRDYRLAYTKPVLNRYDSSYHTKIIHKTLGMELEFATHTIV